MNAADQLAKLHVEAFLELARAHAELGADVYEGKVEDAPERYASVWPSIGGRGAERLDLHSIQITPSFTVHSVGTTPEQARWVGDRVMFQVLDVRPDILGRSCWPIRLTASQPVREDDNLHPGLWYQVDVFEFTSTPKRQP